MFCAMHRASADRACSSKLDTPTTTNTAAATATTAAAADAPGPCYGDAGITIR